MQIMLIILGVLIAPILLGLMFNRPVGQAAATASYPIQPGDSARNGAIGFYKQVQQTTAQCDPAGGFRAVADWALEWAVTPLPYIRLPRKRTQPAANASEPSGLPAPGADDQSATTANLTEYSFDDFPSESYSGPWVAPNFSGAQRPFRQFRRKTLMA
jgi:hypothetical protein